MKPKKKSWTGYAVIRTHNLKKDEIKEFIYSRNLAIYWKNKYESRWGKKFKVIKVEVREI